MRTDIMEGVTSSILAIFTFALGISPLHDSDKIISPIPTEYNNQILGIITKPTPTSTPTVIPSFTPTPTTIPSPTSTPIPTPTTIPTPTIITSQDLEILFIKYANEYSIDKELLKKIARCESGFNPNAVNGPYGGMFQFSESSWISTRTHMNVTTDPALRFNAEEAIRTSAFKISVNGSSAWPSCSN